MRQLFINMSIFEVVSFKISKPGMKMSIFESTYISTRQSYKNQALSLNLIVGINVVASD